MIFHLCEKQAWESALEHGAYKAKSLEEEGFIHLSTYGQVLSIANWMYQDTKEPVLLVIDDNKIGDALKWEGEEGLDFPHIYREIQFDEVVQVLPMRRRGQVFIDWPEFQKAAHAVTIESQRLTLREFQLSDFDAVQNYASNVELLMYMVWGPNDRIETRKFFSRVFKWQAENPREEFHFAVVEKESSKLIGACNLSIESQESKVGSIGYIVSSEFQRKGCATELSQALLSFGFENIGLNRIEATCDEMNGASFGVMKKIGMKKEGLLRENVLVKGRKRSTIISSILKSEYQTK